MKKHDFISYYKKNQKKSRKDLERSNSRPRNWEQKAGYLKTDYVRFSCPALTRTEFGLNRTDFRIDETKQCNQNCFWWWGLKCQTTSRFPPEQTKIHDHVTILTTWLVKVSYDRGVVSSTFYILYLIYETRVKNFEQMLKQFKVIFGSYKGHVNFMIHNVWIVFTVRFQWRRANIPDHSNLVNEENASLAMIQQNLSLTLDL